MPGSTVGLHVGGRYRNLTVSMLQFRRKEAVEANPSIHRQLLAESGGASDLHAIFGQGIGPETWSMDRNTSCFGTIGDVNFGTGGFWQRFQQGSQPSL